MSTKDKHKQSYYELLEVEPNATQEEILKAYTRARATYGNNSPALYSLFNKEEAQQLLRLIDEAYTVLSNQFKRKQYDQGETPSAETDLPSGTSAATPAPAISSSNGEDSFGITRFGKYKIDARIEEEIKATVEFDGASLKKIRLYKNITLDQISDFTKIGRSYLTALETNDKGRLPASVFIRGFLVQYAKILGLDAHRVSNSYLKILGIKEKA